MIRRGGLVLPAMTAVLGTAAGSLLSAVYPTLPLWQSEVFRQGFGTERPGFVRLLGLSCLMLAVIAAAGLSVCGVFGAFAAVFWKGMALGAVLTGLYRDAGFGGFLTSLLFVFPYALCSMLVVLFAAREAYAGACCLTGMVLHRKEMDYPLRRYAVVLWSLALAQTALTGLQYAWLGQYQAFLSVMIQ